jgi:hypothetical protein
VLLPDALAHQLRDAERDAVFLHELSHIIRRDHLTALFTILCGAVLFWNPLYWLVLWQSDLAADESCDLVVLSQGNVQPEQYTDTLLRLVAGERSYPVLQFLSRKEKIMKRINQILSAGNVSALPTQSRLWTASVVLTALLMSITLAFCQEGKKEPTTFDQFTTYEVNKKVADFKDGDLSTPEATYATFNKAMASKNKDVIAKLGEYQAEKVVLPQREIDNIVNMPDDFVAALQGANILKVCVHADQEAIVIAHLPGENIRNPYDIRWLKKVDGQWLNTGNDRVDSPDAAMNKFAQSVQQAGVTSLEKFIKIEGLKHYPVGKCIADFPADKIDLSSPEASYATQKNLIVSNRKDKFEQLSNMTQGRPKISERERRGMENISEDRAKRYREQFVVHEVFILNDKHAFVFGLRQWDNLYDGNFFIKEGNEWLNMGNDQNFNAENIAKSVQQAFSRWQDGGYTTPRGGYTHMLVFGPKGDFKPRTPGELLNVLNASLIPTGIATGYFRTAPENDRLIGRICTNDAEGLKKVIESVPQLEYIKTERLTKEMFEAYEKTAQESLPSPPSPQMAEIEKTDWYGKLNEKQKKYVQWDEQQFAYAYDPKNYEVNDGRDELEKRWLAELDKPEPGHPGNTLSRYDEAIIGLATIKSDKALKPLLKIAAERVIKDNAHRHFATKALGILGDPSAIPELIPLLYHFNFNTRWEAQVSLVRLTGQNFGSDVQAWGEWYMANRDKLGKDLPAFDSSPVDWSCGSTNQEIQRYCDPKVQEESDNQFFGRIASQGAVSSGQAPVITKMEPANGAKDVDAKAVKELRVTFDRDMSGGMSWTGGGELFPKSPENSKAKWIDKRTCVLPVELEPGKSYRLGINAPNFQNFRSAVGVPVVPVTYTFSTAR